MELWLSTMELLLRVFTHPSCASCGPVVKMCWELAEAMDEIELRTVKMETKAGLAEAHKERIKTIPSVILSRGDEELARLVGTPTKESLEQAIKGGATRQE